MPVLKDRMMAVHRQYQIVPLPEPREIYLGVINDMVCAYRSRYVHIPRTAYGSNFSPKSLAICTANVPTPPDAPSIRTLWPG